jgi:hypothetical protein
MGPLDLLVDAVRNQETHRLPSLDHLTDLGRRNIKDGSGHLGDPEAGYGRYRKAGSRINVKRIVADQDKGIFPFGKIHQAVCSHQDREAVGREFFLEIGHRVNCIGGAWKMELYIADPDILFPFHRELGQVEALVFVEQVPAGLKGILRGNNQPDLVKVRILDHVAGDDAMAYMDGVERAEIETNFHLVLKINYLILVRFHKNIMCLVQPETQVVAGDADGYGIPQGSYLIHRNYLAGNTSHFHEFEEYIIVFKGLDHYGFANGYFGQSFQHVIRVVFCKKTLFSG